MLLQQRQVFMYAWIEHILMSSMEVRCWDIRNLTNFVQLLLSTQSGAFHDSSSLLCFCSINSCQWDTSASLSLCASIVRRLAYPTLFSLYFSEHFFNCGLAGALRLSRAHLLQQIPQIISFCNVSHSSLASSLLPSSLPSSASASSWMGKQMMAWATQIYNIH